MAIASANPPPTPPARAAVFELGGAWSCTGVLALFSPTGDEGENSEGEGEGEGEGDGEREEPMEGVGEEVGERLVEGENEGLSDGIKGTAEQSTWSRELVHLSPEPFRYTIWPSSTSTLDKSERA